MRLTIALGLLALSAAPALAGQAEAQSCAAGLDPNAALIFNATLPQVGPGADLKQRALDAVLAV